ncbi:NADP-dependent oxidoreductase domain-containing protein, partial [Gaertneriomyces semiglobifer]
VGTYRLQGELCKEVIKDAIRAGYKLFDTAAVYRNEEGVGAALTELIQTNVVKRQDVFVTTKIAPRDQGYDKAYQAGIECIRKLGPHVEYIDLLLIHWPGTQGRKVHDPRNAANRRESWRALQKLRDEGKVKAIGVSNFEIEHLRGLEGAGDVPIINQFELHPMNLPAQKELVDFCEANGIQCQAYSSFGEGKLLDGTYDLPELQSIATKHHATPAQILLSWAMTHGWCVIPKASTCGRLQENIRAVKLQLTNEEVATIDKLSDKREIVKFCWDPKKVA